MLHDHALDRLREVNVQEAPLDAHRKSSSARLLRETRMESHGPDARRAVSAPSDRRRVCPLHSQLARTPGVILNTAHRGVLSPKSPHISY
jgi:hypothetical protein